MRETITTTTTANNDTLRSIDEEHELSHESAPKSRLDCSMSSVVSMGYEDHLGAEESEQVIDGGEVARSILCPFGVPIQCVPLSLAFVAMLFSFSGSWHCSYFNGADISFTGSHFGLWTLEDIEGKCQRWDVLFFSYKLGAPLAAARVFSMACMLIGLSLVTVMAQALQFHIVSYGIGLFFLGIFLFSVSTSSIFNVWIVFFLFTYMIFILLARFAFIHPFHRRISRRGRLVIAGLLALCSNCSTLTLVVLRSDFCTCKDINTETLAGRDPGEPCNGDCELGTAGWLTMLSALFYLLAAAAVLKWGVQHEELEEYILSHPELKHYDHYATRSVFSRIVGNHKAKEVDATHPFSIPKRLSTAPNEDFFHQHDSAFHDDDSIASHEDHIENVVAAIGHQSVGDTRSRCQKLCCDFRVTKRTKGENIGFWIYRIGLGFLVGIYIFLVAILIGSRNENTQAAKAPDTSYNFVTDVVCAFNPLDPFSPFQDFPTKADAEQAGFEVAHCGGCGVCSNPHDLQTYVLTRKTIAKSAKKCGSKAVLGSEIALTSCLQGKIGFTPECTTCWADNMKTTSQKCLFTCMVTLFTGFMSNNNVPGAGEQGWLNQCLFCDEKMSGPAFVTCSGVARRRLGIRSEIERNPEEQCTNVDIDWVTANFTELFPPQR